MILKRLAVTLTLTLKGKGIVDRETTPDTLKKIVWEIAQQMTVDEFVADVGLWQTMTGEIEEPKLLDDSVDNLDRSIIHQIHVDNAKEILCSEATIRALVTTFSMLTTGTQGLTQTDDIDLKLKPSD